MHPGARNCSLTTGFAGMGRFGVRLPRKHSERPGTTEPGSPRMRPRMDGRTWWFGLSMLPFRCVWAHLGWYLVAALM